MPFGSSSSPGPAAVLGRQIGSARSTVPIRASKSSSPVASLPGRVRVGAELATSGEERTCSTSAESSA